MFMFILLSTYQVDFSGLGTSDKSSSANSFPSEKSEFIDLLLFLAYST